MRLLLASLVALLLASCAPHFLVLSDEARNTDDIRLAFSDRRSSFLLDVINPSETAQQDVAEKCGNPNNLYGYEVRTDAVDVIISLLSLGLLPSHTVSIYCKY